MGKNYQLTFEQEAILDCFQNDSSNLLINARAGSGKTFILVEGAKLLPKDKSILFLAFNKHIQIELKTKLPEYVSCYTTYGIGNLAIKRKYGDSIQFDDFKIDKIIQNKALTWSLENEFKDNTGINYYLNSMKKLVNLCRLTLTIKPEDISTLCIRHDILNLNNSKDSKRVFKVLDEATNNRTSYDYVDMVYLPAIDHSITLFQYDYILVDENQDISPVQQKLIEKLIKKNKTTGKYYGRLISAGDRFQKIYTFAGVSNKTLDWFGKFPNTRTLQLSYSFRCSKNIIKKAQEIVPDIKATDNACDGIVRTGDVLNEAKSGDFVLCRTTKPLVELFFLLLEENKKAMINGKDFGIDLISLIGTISNISNLIVYWNKELFDYSEKLKLQGVLNPNEHGGYVALEDKVNALLFLAKQSKSIKELITRIETIFTNEIEGIVLSTIHKSKGLESDRVFIIRPDLIPLPSSKGEEADDEKNLEYIAITRAKLELVIDEKYEIKVKK